MSGTHSTLADRTPSILNKDQPSDKKPKNEKSPISLKHEFDPTGMVQRCVIIQRDENGFGLTVSGDNPVFVQLVKEDGAAMRAGVQTGDRIIKVNGTLVTHSNHIEVVKLIKSGSYVALTVLGRPPGHSQFPLGEEEEELASEEEEEEEGRKEEEEEEEKEEEMVVQEGEEREEVGGGVLSSSHSSSPAQPRAAPTGHSPEQYHAGSPTPLQNNVLPGQSEVADEEAMLTPRELKCSPPLDGSSDQLCHPVVSHSVPGNPLLLSPSQSETSCHGLKTNLDDVTNLCPLPDPDDPSYHMMNQSQAPASCERERVSFAPMVATGHHDRIQTAENPSTQCIIGTSPSPPNPPIIGAEDDYFDTQQEQMNGQCSCFQSMELLKSRPAHLAAFLHHVVSQFDPAPLLCYLYADLHRHTSSKESRRVFMDFHSLFLDRVANLKVPVPESVSAELERKRLELIPEDLCKRYTQQLQETLLPDILKNLEDFRQKRSMGLTLAEDQLTRLELDRERGKLSTEKESTCAEHIISKIEDILMTPHPAEEEKCATMQYVMLTYMKHLGVKVKEARSLEPKRVRINFLPKIKTRIKPEKEGEEKVKRPRFPSILGQPRRPSRVEPASISKAMELTKQRSPKQQAQHPISSVPDHPDPSLPSRTRCSQSSDGSDAGSHALPHAASPPPHITSANYTSDNSGQESDSGLTPSSPHQSERGCHSAEHQECVPSPAATMHFDFSPSTLEHLPEEEHSAASLMDSSGGAGTPAEVHSEDDQAPGCGVFDGQEDPLNWQRLVSREVLAGLTPLEVKRQEVINELLYTEQAHLRMLKVLDSVFYQRLSRDSILPPDDIRHIFANLEEVIQLHVSITEQMATIRKRSESSVIGHIGEDLLAWFGGEEEENMKQAVGSFCSNQPLALEIIKTRQKKEQRFISFIQEAESNRLCRRLQLKDIIPIEMQRLTKYPLLLERLAKYTENTEERDKVKKAGDCCRNVLSHVNQAVKEAENKQRLVDYQRRLDLSSLKQSENPMVLEFKNLDLTKGKMVHEGPLYWKVNKDKTIELYTVLLEEVLVLLQKQDERLVLKCHSKNLAGTADTKHIFSPIIKLNNVLVRPVATDNKSFFVISMSDSGAQIYELTAQTVSEQRTWQCLITQCAETMKARGRSVVPHVQTSTEQATLEIMNSGLTKASREPLCTLTGRIQSADKEDKENTSSSLVLHTPPTISTNPFEGTDSDEDEYVESAPADRADEEEVEEEEVDVDELEAFLDGELADRLPLLQERSRQGIAIDSQEHLTLNLPCSRAAEALKTLATLKQLLLDHMVSREEKKADIDDEPALRSNSVGNFSWARRAPSAVSADSNAAEGNAEKAEPELQPRHLGLFETPESNGDYIVLQSCSIGSEESYTDDGWGEAHRQASSGDMVGLTSGIDLTKLLSSSSQTGGDGNDSGPNLSRQLMTHLRLLQANLQHLKEVEERYNQLCHTGTEMATDSEECNGQMSRMSEER